jgi:hypothetical protein
MRLKGLLFLTMTLLACPLAAGAQSGQEFVDPNGRFKLTLVSDWKAVSYNDAVGRNKTEFVYRDRSEGLLKISRETLNGPVANLVRQEEENLKSYRAGFERAANEAFGAGPLRGMRFSFYSTDGGRQMANTYYYLQDGNTVWVLRFTGRRGVIDTTRNLTDQIARSFQTM